MPDAGQGLEIFKKMMNRGYEVITFTLLSMGGVDVLGGWAFHNLLCKLGGHSTNDEEMIDTGSKSETTPDFELQQEGLNVLDKLFSGELGLKVPFYWRSISLL